MLVENEDMQDLMHGTKCNEYVCQILHSLDLCHQGITGGNICMSMTDDVYSEPCFLSSI